MGLDGLLLHCLVRELNHALVNARVHRVMQPRANDIVLVLRQPGVNYRLLLSADPGSPRLHLTDADLPNPLAPPPFCMLLRKHLEPGRLLGIDQPGLERIVTLRFETRDELGNRAERHLSLELMGRHSNMLLIDPATGTLLDGIRHVTSTQSRHREVLPGRPYVAPPAQGKADPFTVTEADFLFALRHVPAPQSLAEALVQRYDGLGPDAAREILARAGLDPATKRGAVEVHALAHLWGAFQGVVQLIASGDIAPWGAADASGQPTHFWVLPLSYLGTSGVSHKSVNDLLEWYYGTRQQAADLEAMRNQLLRAVQAAAGRVAHRIELQYEALRDAEQAADYRLKGELLLAYPHLVPEKATSVLLPNHYEPGTSIEVALNPALSASENAQNYFRRYQKARKTQQQAQLQLEAAQAEYSYLESLVATLQLASTIGDLEEIASELVAQQILARPDARRKPAAQSTPGYLRVTAADGTEILVGKNNYQNDAITMGLAKPDDLWLHVKDIPGAHVLVRCGGKPVSDSTLELALHLAAYYSKARQSSQVPVDYCQRRYVRKPKGAKPGFVIYDHQKTAYVTPDPELIDRRQAR